jgi:hypothetical protein
MDQVTYLGVRLNCAWTWDTYIAAAYHKGLQAFHTWRPVLVSLHTSVVAKLRNIHSVIRPILEYGVEVGPACTLGRRGEEAGRLELPSVSAALSSTPSLCVSPGLRCRALPSEPGWTRRACVSPEVLLSVCQVLSSERACDFAHLCYSEHLQAASRLPRARTSLHFRVAAHAALAFDHPWLQRMSRTRSSQQIACSSPACSPC